MNGTISFYRSKDLPCTDPDAFLEAVQKICGIISQIGAKVILYQTWAYEDGSEKLASTGMTYEEMSEKLKTAYDAAAEATGAIVAPVGEFFSQITRSDHITHLINRNDNYHPSTSGSYLAACLLFKLITGKTTIGLPSPSNVSLYNMSVVQKVSDSFKV